MKINLWAFTILFVLLVYSCENSRDNLKLFNKLKNEVINNYNIQKQTFEKLNFFLNSKLKHIQLIEFFDNGNVNIEYQTGDLNSEWKKVENKGIFSGEVEKILNLDGIKVDELLQIKKYSTDIKVKKIWITNNLDILSGRYFKQVELNYSNKMNGIQFYYKIYETPLSNPENKYYQVLIQNDSTGSKLDNNVIWYYK